MFVLIFEFNYFAIKFIMYAVNGKSQGCWSK